MVVNLWASSCGPCRRGDAGPPGLPRGSTATRSQVIGIDYQDAQTEAGDGRSAADRRRPTRCSPTRRSTSAGRRRSRRFAGCPYPGARRRGRPGRSHQECTIVESRRRAVGPGQRASRDRPVIARAGCARSRRAPSPSRARADHGSPRRPDGDAAPGRGADAVRRGRAGRRAAADRARPRHALAPRAGLVPRRRRSTRARPPSRRALREAEEEIGLDPAGVEVFGRLPELWLPPSNFAVTPVLGWWREPSAGQRRRPERGARDPPRADRRAARPRAPDHGPAPVGYRARAS